MKLAIKNKVLEESVVPLVLLVHGKSGQTTIVMKDDIDDYETLKNKII